MAEHAFDGRCGERSCGRAIPPDEFVVVAPDGRTLCMYCGARAILAWVRREQHPNCRSVGFPKQSTPADGKPRLGMVVHGAAISPTMVNTLQNKELLEAFYEDVERVANAGRFWKRSPEHWPPSIWKDDPR